MRATAREIFHQSALEATGRSQQLATPPRAPDGMGEKTGKVDRGESINLLHLSPIAELNGCAAPSLLSLFSPFSHPFGPVQRSRHRERLRISAGRPASPPRRPPNPGRPGRCAWRARAGGASVGGREAPPLPDRAAGAAWPRRSPWAGGDRAARGSPLAAVPDAPPPSRPPVMTPYPAARHAGGQAAAPARRVSER